MKVYRILIALVIGLSLATSPVAASEQVFKIANSHYTGWEFWWLAKHLGILDKWAAKKGIKIELSDPMDYGETMNLFSAGAYDACTMTNMDALINPCVGGVDTTVVIVGDFSNGNDGVVVLADPKTGKAPTVAELKGKSFGMVMNSVSFYLYAKWLESIGLKEKEMGQPMNMSDSDIGPAFAAHKVKYVVTWNPILMEIRNVKGAKMIFDSSKIPGEIMDLLVVKTSAPAAFKEAVVGAWYETMAVMTAKGKGEEEAIRFMAQFTNQTEQMFRAQLKTTHMFYKPGDALSFVTSKELKQKMDSVREFCFNHGLYAGANSKDYVGIMYPDGSVAGDGKNVKMRFDASFTKMAVEGKL